MPVRSTAALALLCLVPIVVRAQEVALSLDTTAELAGTTLADHEAASDDQAGTVSVLPLGSLPERTDVDAYHRYSDGDQLYSLDTIADLGAGVVATGADVVRLAGAAETLEFDASAEGIPDGVGVDAIAVHASDDLLLSFDVGVDLGGGLVVGDEDLVRFDGVGTFTLLFDGSAAGVSAGLDLDAADYRASDGHLFLSFDGSGSLGGVDFSDEDVLEHDPSGPSWTLFYDGSAQHASLVAADVNALPEPKPWLQLPAAFGTLLLLARARARRALDAS